MQHFLSIWETAMNDSKLNKNGHDPSISEQSASLFVSQDDSLAALLLEHGIRVRDFVILSFLADQGSMCIVQLARVIGIEPIRIIESLQRLAAAGLVIHAPKGNSADANEIARLTGRGQDIFCRINEQL
jgi:DNA-binding MarR family transcriptional regulator